MSSSLAAGTHVDDDVLVAAGSRTTAGQRLESEWLCGGRPARPISRLSEPMRETILSAAAVHVEYAKEFAANQSPGRDP